MTLMQLRVQDFNNELLSSSPAPGGGSVAALCGALGTALCMMVANLTVDKKKYRDAQNEMQALLKTAETLNRKMTELVDEDTKAYLRVTEAFKQPSGTPAEKNVRKAAIQDALKAAAEVPFQTLKTATPATDLVFQAVDSGNPNCITDAGVAAELILTAVRGAAYNVCINLMDIKDTEFTTTLKKETQALLKKTEQNIESIRRRVYRAVQLI